MAVVTVPHRSTRLGRLSAALRALGDCLVLLIQAGPRSETLQRLYRISDEELASRGTIREAEIRRIMGIRG